MAIAIQNRRKSPRLSTPCLEKIAQAVCVELGYGDAELSLVVVDDAAIHALNLEWRSKDKPTDVLSFPQEDMPMIPGLVMLGDVVISADTADRQAKSIGHSLEAEFRRLIVHGILHLLGHDHVHGGRQAAKMKREEERLLDHLDSVLGLA